MNIRPYLSETIPADDYFGNAVGVFTRAVSDKVDQAVRKVSGLSTSACYAIVTIGTEPNSTIDELRRMLNLEHSTVVRLMDRLQTMDFITRKKATGERADRRQVRIELTEAGEEIFTKILDARRAILNNLISDFSEEEKLVFHRFIERLLPKTVEAGDDQNTVCRLCELEVCPAQICPVNNSFPENYREPEVPFKRKVASRTG